MLPRPLLGAVLCCTSITPEDRTRLAEYAEQMGAEHKLDLTSDVTHLLVGSTDTPKYQYVAREREDVKVLRPEWVEAVRECWMEDRPLDMNALEAEFRVPTLAGLKICITGFEDLNFRSQLQKNVIANGGEYSGDLTKDVTHLIAAGAEGKKYEYATLWQKKVVSLQWYKDTLQRGMQLDEASYHPSRPLQEQGVGAWNKQDPNEIKVGKRTRGDQPLQEPVRKLRRIASAKLGSQTENMWGDIVGQAPQQSTTASNTLRPSKSVPDIGERKQFPSEGKRSDQSESITVSGGGFLSGLRFVVTRFENKKATLVVRTLQAAGATVLETGADLAKHDEDGSNNAYLIVPHQTQAEEIMDLESFAIKPTIVTELWLERCMLQRAFIPPHKYPLGGIIAKVNSPDIADFMVNATGFQSIETLHIAKTIALTGAKYTEVFTPKSSVLICNSMNINKQKLFHANEWNIPAVSESWLCRFLTEGFIPDFEEYTIKDGEDDSNDLEAELNQKRLGRNPRRPKDDDESGGGQGAGKGQSTSMRAQSQPSATGKSGKSPDRQQNQNQGGRQQYSENAKESTALQEISPNSPSRRDRLTTSPRKKSLFRSYDGASTLADQKSKQPQIQPPEQRLNQTSPHKPVQDTVSINSAIEDLLNMKAKVKANELARQAEPRDKKRRLFGRALSNLSNASHGSHQSRASSVDSLNTDGLGSEIAPPSGRSVINNEGTVRKPSLQGRAQGKSTPAALHGSLYNSAPIDLSDPHLLRDELEAAEEGPQLTQLGYEDSEEAIAMREKLAEKRRARSKLGQNEGDPKPEISGRDRETLKQRSKQKQVIKDDETLNATGWGGGGRTRAKNRSTDFMDSKMF